MAGFGLKRGEATPGAILLARVGKGFLPDETSLLRIAGSQIDNALRYFALANRLRQEALALRTVLKVDRIRDTSNTLDELLNRAPPPTTASWPCLGPWTAWIRLPRKPSIPASRSTRLTLTESCGPCSACL